MGFKEILLKEFIPTVLSKSAEGATDVTKKFIGNYTKRRNVGFTVKQSISGSWKETDRYYNDVFVGKEPTEMKEAIIFLDKT